MRENSARGFGVFDLKIERFRAVADGLENGCRTQNDGARAKNDAFWDTRTPISGRMAPRNVATAQEVKF
jgi:hypothetical protein